MSVCTFLAADCPLATWEPSQNYPLELNLDDGTIEDGGAEDNYFLQPFEEVQDYTDKQNGVSLE